MPSPPQMGNEVTCCCSTIFQSGISSSVSLSGWCHCGCQRCSIQVPQKKVCTIPQLSSCQERCNARSNRDTHLKAEFTLIVIPRITRLSFTQQMILTVALWIFTQRVSPPQKTIRVSEESKATFGRRVSGAPEDAEYPMVATSRLRHSPIWESPGAPKQGPLVTNNRYVLARFHPHDHSSITS